MAIIGIDCGATKTEILLSQSVEKNHLLNPLERHRIPTNKEGGYFEFLNRVQKEVEAMLKKRGVQLETLGIGIPGVVDPSDHKVKKTSVTCLFNQALPLDLAKIFGVAVAIENDAKCFALAEAKLGAGKNYKSMLGLILGTGVAGGFLMDSKLLRGKHGLAGEFGHWVLNPMGAKCYCGNKGCMETMISGSALERIYAEYSGKKLTVPAIYELYKTQDFAAQQAIGIYLENFALAISNLINLYDPDVIVLGGGVSNLDFLYQLDQEKILRHLFSDFFETPIVKNQLGDSSGIYGACLLE